MDYVHASFYSFTAMNAECITDTETRIFTHVSPAFVQKYDYARKHSRCAFILYFHMRKSMWLIAVINARCGRNRLKK